MHISINCALVLLSMNCALALCATVALLTGCAAAGVQVTDQQAQSFQVGRATYADVVAQLGEPTTVSTSTNGRGVAVYSYAAMSARPQNFIPYIGTKSSAVVFTFDAQGILRETSSTQSNAGVGANLAAGTPFGAGDTGAAAQPR
jgi:outer membrane protein assembly factor BamE (lipoprotein component of BamABCDE complex)